MELIKIQGVSIMKHNLKLMFIFVAIFSAGMGLSAQTNDVGITVDSTGNVGINTDTPAAELEVNGDAIVDETLTVKKDATFDEDITVKGGDIKDDDGIPRIQIDTENDLNLRDSQRTRVEIKDNGDVVIKNTTSATAVNVNANGNVAIGKDPAGAKLDITAPNGVSAITVNGVEYAYVPRGVIVMWSGNPNALPAGWALCDGTSYSTLTTPDLRGRFIVGYSPAKTDYDTIAKTGGEEKHILTEAELATHSHTGTALATNSSHKHTFQERSAASAPVSGYSQVPGAGGGWVTQLRETELSGDHAHALSINTDGLSTAHENRPPYYVLAYIIKL
jgi:microcystin-dependent protein